MIFACPSVPHNGHHFMLNRIFIGYDNTPPMKYLQTVSKGVISGHFHPSEIKYWMQIVSNYRTIVPLRHPARNYASIKKRNTTIATPEKFHQQWQAMIDMEPYFTDPLYLHLDCLEVREHEVAIILDVLELEHEVDWSVSEETGSKHNTHALEITEEMLEPINYKYLDFYYSTMPREVTNERLA